MMAQNQSSFRALRNSLYRSLVTCACIPQLEIDGVVAEQPEKRFFPAGTAESILTTDVLRHLFTSIVAPGKSHAFGLQPSQLAYHVEVRELHVFLAVLIISKCDIEPLLSFTEKLVAPRTWTEAEHKLAKLPVEHSHSLRVTLGDDVTADDFLQKQHEFFSPVIHKNKEIRGHFRRLPYVSEKLIGQGSFGKIYAVVISRHHFQDAHSMSNKEEIRLARKDFELNSEDRAYEKERDILQEIVRNAKKHSNIMTSLGSMENGLTYSLFMPLADCDLKQYMERHPRGPKSPLDKAKIVQCAVGLTGAIEYLHEELESPDYEKLSCFHMDLKPQNILVVIDPITGEENWKLSDFNMSRVKMKRKHSAEQLSLRRGLTFGDNVYEINRIFKRRLPDVANTESTDYTINRRGTGTYLAPEACVDGHSVQAESDIWSLGCVISVVFSYLYGGHSAVEEFANKRYQNSLDRFFSISGGNELHSLSNVQVSDAVKRWHKHLRMKTLQADAQEGAIFEDMIEFLRRKVLLVDPKRRRETAAGDIRNSLIASWKAYQSMSNAGPMTPKIPKSRFRMSSLVKRSWRRQPEVDVHSQVWNIPSKGEVRTCVFGPNAHPLLCVTDTTITAYSLEHVLLLDDLNDFKENLMLYGEAFPEKGRKWIPSVGVSSQNILAATDNEEFECYFYHIAQPNNHNSKLELVNHWQLKLPRIRKVALSADGRYAAFVLFHAPLKQHGSLHITGLDWLQDTQPGRYVLGVWIGALISSSCFSLSASKFYSIASSSSASSSSSSSPIGAEIELPCPAEDVCELRFSEFNGVYVVAKTANNVRSVFAWSLQSGRAAALASSPIKHDGQDDLLRGLFTCFAPYNQKMAYAFVSEENIVIIRVWETKRYTQSIAKGYRLLHILLDQDDREVLAFGTRQAHNELQLLTFSTANTSEELDVKHKKKLPNMTHQSKFIAVITNTTRGSLTERHLLIAIMEGLSVRIVCITLSP